MQDEVAGLKRGIDAGRGRNCRARRSLQQKVFGGPFSKKGLMMWTVAWYGGILISIYRMFG